MLNNLFINIYKCNNKNDKALIFNILIRWLYQVYQNDKVGCLEETDRI